MGNNTNTVDLGKINFKGNSRFTDDYKNIVIIGIIIIKAILVKSMILAMKIIRLNNYK